MASYKIVKVPQDGQAIRMGSDGKLQVPDNPILPFIEGDGTGPDIWRASQRVFDAAVAKAYGGKKKIARCEVYAGAEAFNHVKKLLPEEALTPVPPVPVRPKGPP